MTGLDALNPLSVVFDPDANQIWDCPLSEEKLKEFMKDFRESVIVIHRKVETSVKSSRAFKRRNCNKKRSAVKNDQGDYVVIAVGQTQNLSKLQSRWNGPYQITEVAKHLVGKTEKTVHDATNIF